MPVSLTSLNDDLISQVCIQSFTAHLAPLAAFSTSYSADAARRGTTITVPIVSNVSATTAYPAYETADTGTAVGRDLVLTNYYKSTCSVSDQQFHGSSFVDVEKFATQLGAAVSTAIQTQVFGLITSSNFSASVTGAAASFGLAGVRAARLQLSTNNAPLDHRSIVLSPAGFNSILSDVGSAYIYGGPQAIQNAGPLNVYGLKIMESTIVPSNSQNLYGFACDPKAIALAVRPLVPQDSSYYIEARVIQDPDSGLSCSFRRHYSPALGTHFLTIEALCGMAVGLGNGLVRLVSA